VRKGDWFLVLCAVWALLATAAIVVPLIIGAARADTPEPIRLADEVHILEGGGDASQYGYPAPALGLNTGDIWGVRNIQGGWWDPLRPSMLNLDVGAGSAEHPGILNLGADVSRAVRIQGDGRTLFRADEEGITLRGPIRVCRATRCYSLSAMLRNR
jgi:hypothetical protein